MNIKSQDRYDEDEYDEIDTECTEHPVCPHCGKEDQDWWDGLPSKKRDGDTWDINCFSCRKKYTVEMSVIVRFSTSKQD